MKKVILVTGALIALVSGAQAQTVRIATEGAYAPWNFLNEAGQPAGFEIELGNAICAKAELACEWIINDWDSIIPNLLAGNYDLIMAGMSITDERLKTIDFTQSYFPPDPSKFAARSGTDLNFVNLSGARIGVQGGTIQAFWAEENLSPENTVIAFNTADQAMADLSGGNLDVVFADGGYVDPVVAASNGVIEFVGNDILIGDGFGAGLRKNEDALRARLDNAISALKSDGTIDKMIARWFEGKGPYFAD